MHEELSTLTQRRRNALDWLRPNAWLDEWIPTPLAARDSMLAAFDRIGGSGSVLRRRTRTAIEELANAAMNIDAEMDAAVWRRSNEFAGELYRQSQVKALGSPVRWSDLALFGLVFVRAMETGDTPMRVALETLKWEDRVPCAARDFVLECCRFQAAAWPLAPITSDPFDSITPELVRVRATYYFYAFHESDPGVVLNVAALSEKGAELAQARLAIALSSFVSESEEGWEHFEPGDLLALPEPAREIALLVGARAAASGKIPEEADPWLEEAARLSADNPWLHWPMLQRLATRALDQGDPARARELALKAEVACVRARVEVPPTVRRLAHARIDTEGRLAKFGLPEDLFLREPLVARQLVVKLIEYCVDDMPEGLLGPALEHFAEICAPSDACTAAIEEARAELAALEGDHGVWCLHTRRQLAAEDRCGVRAAPGVAFEPSPPANRTGDSSNEANAEGELFVFDPLQRAHECEAEARDALERDDIPSAEFWRDVALEYSRQVRPPGVS